MTRQEQIKFCSICKNKKNDFEKGVICNLTQDKATFENSCENFEPDLEEIKKRTGKDVDLNGIAKNDIPSYVDSIREEQIGNKLGGWTIFFIVTIFLSLGRSIYSAVQSIHEFNELDFIPETTSLKIFLVYISIYCILGIYTVFCLITKKSNAVAVMRTFLIVGLIDAVRNLIFAATNNELTDNRGMRSIFQSLTYFSVWFTYSFQSQNLQTVFPINKRTWRLPEKTMGVVSIISCILLFISTEKMMKSVKENAIGNLTEQTDDNNLSVKNLIENILANVEFPRKINENTTSTGASFVNNIFTIKAKFDNITYSEAKKFNLIEIEQESKDEILNSLKESKLISIEKIIFTQFAKENITIKNECYSSDDKLIYSITITPEDIYSRIK